MEQAVTLDLSTEENKIYLHQICNQLYLQINKETVEAKNIYKIAQLLRPFEKSFLEWKNIVVLHIHPNIINLSHDKINNQKEEKEEEQEEEEENRKYIQDYYANCGFKIKEKIYFFIFEENPTKINFFLQCGSFVINLLSQDRHKKLKELTQVENEYKLKLEPIQSKSKNFILPISICPHPDVSENVKYAYRIQCHSYYRTNWENAKYGTKYLCGYDFQKVQCIYCGEHFQTWNCYC